MFCLLFPNYYTKCSRNKLKKIKRFKTFFFNFIFVFNASLPLFITNIFIKVHSKLMNYFFFFIILLWLKDFYNKKKKIKNKTQHTLV